jgi:glycosyltransferase involved in cell wall biosynthesis
MPIGSENTSPSVSVIIPAYNYGRFVRRTIESVQAQSYADWECIVVDDGSTDDTEEVVTPLLQADRRIKFVKQKNAGLAAARNAGLAKSAGEYLQFLDADDLIEANKLEHQVNFLEQHPEVDIVFGEARYFRSGHEDERRFSQYDEDLPWVGQVSGTGGSVLLRLLANNLMVVSGPLLRRSVIDDVGLFEGVVKGIEDWDYWVRCAAAGKIFHYDDAEGARTLIRFHDNSMSTDARLMLNSTLLMHRRVAQLVTDPEVRRFNSQRMAERHGLLGIEEVAAGNLARGIRGMCRAAFCDRVLRHKAKWLACAACAPFVSRHRLRQMVTFSLTGWLRKGKSTGSDN